MVCSVFCIASGTDHAENIVRTLKDSGFSGSDISVLFPDKRTTCEPEHPHRITTEEATTGTGGMARGTLGLLDGMASLAIPGLGTFIAAGPIIASLPDHGEGLSSALMSMGVAEYEAKRYEGKLRAGNALVTVHCDNAGDVAEARRIFEDSGALDTYATSAASAEV